MEEWAIPASKTVVQTDGGGLELGLESILRDLIIRSRVIDLDGTLSHFFLKKKSVE